MTAVVPRAGEPAAPGEADGDRAWDAESYRAVFGWEVEYRDNSVFLVLGQGLMALAAPVAISREALARLRKFEVDGPVFAVDGLRPHRGRRRGDPQGGSVPRTGAGMVPDVVLSVDTWRHQVGKLACAEGADLLNDTWAGADPALAEVAAEFGAGYVCSHTGGVPPRTRPHRVSYPNLV